MTSIADSASFDQIPCPQKVAWCDGHNSHELQDFADGIEPIRHHGVLATSASTDIHVDKTGDDPAWFWADIEVNVTSSEVGRKVAELHAFADAFEAAAKSFLESESHD